MSFGRSLRTGATAGAREAAGCGATAGRTAGAATAASSTGSATGAATTGAGAGAATGTGAGAGADAAGRTGAGAGALGLADTGAGAGAVSRPNSRRSSPPKPPGRAGAGAGAGAGATTGAAATGAGSGAGGLAGTGAATGTGSGAGSGAGVTSCHCDAGPVSTTGRASAGTAAGASTASGAATGAPRRPARRSAAAASSEAGVTGLCTHTAPSTCWGWVDSAMPGRPLRARKASQCRRDSSVSKSKMATSATSSPLGAKLLRPELEKKKSSTACVRGGRDRRATFNRVCSLEASTDYRLKVVGNRSWIWSRRANGVSDPARRHRTVARDQPLGHRGLRGVVAAVAIDRQQLAQDLVVLRRVEKCFLKHATGTLQVAVFE